jgi:ParB family chromosome partitioning protein
VVKTLVAAAQAGRFDHAVQRARDDRTERAALRSLTEQWEADRLTVIERPGHHSPTRPLSWLTDPDGQPLDAEQHRGQCPGHVVWPVQEWRLVDADGNQLDADDPDLTGGGLGGRMAGDDMGARGRVRRPRQARTPRPVRVRRHQQPEDDRPDDRRRARAGPGRAADGDREQQGLGQCPETARRDWLTQFVARKTAPKHAAGFVATALAVDADTVTSIGGNHLAAELLGCTATGYGRSTELAGLAEAATPARAQMLTLAIVVAGYEAGRMALPTDAHARYLRFLADCGYTLSNVERIAAGLSRPRTTNHTEHGRESRILSPARV